MGRYGSVVCELTQLTPRLLCGLVCGKGVSWETTGCPDPVTILTVECQWSSGLKGGGGGSCPGLQGAHCLVGRYGVVSKVVVQLVSTRSFLSVWERGI